MKTIRALLFFTALLAGPAPLALAGAAGALGLGAALPGAPMQGLSGPSRLLSDFRGKPLIINVWASWCAPCRQEMGSLDRLARRYGGKQFAVIGISTDDYPEKAKAFLKTSGSRFEHFIDTRLVLETLLGADRLPLTLLIDAQGRVLARHYGAKEWDSPEAVQVIARTLGITL